MISSRGLERAMSGERSNCPICGHDFRSDTSEGARLVHTSPSGMFKAPHLQENHADYLAWKKSKFKPSIVAGIATGIIFDFLLAWFSTTMAFNFRMVARELGRSWLYSSVFCRFHGSCSTVGVSAGSDANGTNEAVSLHRIDLMVDCLLRR